MPNSYSLRRGTLYHAPETVPARSRISLRHNSAPLIHESPLERRRITVQGLVQGAGFRAFIARLARRCSLSGHVLSDSTGVIVEVQGSEPSIEGFLEALLTDAPPFAHVNAINTELLAVSATESEFTEMQSQVEDERHAIVPPDSAICADCLRELFDPTNRRYSYPFISCATCGPRFTIIEGTPEDRNHTTMHAFPMCRACQAEYDDPSNRRYHVQAICCPTCGPRVRFLDKEQRADRDADAIVAAAQLLAAGAIIALEGPGGYQLACDALNEEAVRRLRQNKRSEDRPFALMVPDVETALSLCALDEGERTLLQSAQRPIVPLQCRDDASVCQLASSVAPECCTLGIMLPHAPLHSLLLDAYRRAVGAERPLVLVMTSGNLSGEPVAYRDEDAIARLLPLVDGMLLHDRAIHAPCEESVVRDIAGGEQILRRSRGYVSEPLSMPWKFPVPLLACGGPRDNTFCLGKERQAYLSQALGNIESPEMLLSLRESLAHFQRCFGIQPEAVAYDLHPDNLVTRYANELDIPCKIGVQHHHAHIASVLTEYGLTEPVIGIAADGSGYGSDGAIWGGEVMIADLVKFERVAHLAYVPLPGGEQATCQPWRMAAAYLTRAYGSDLRALNIPFTHKMEYATWRTLSRTAMTMQTSSLGRLFDAVAALLGLGSYSAYEGQAAHRLEMLAATCKHPVVSYPYAISAEKPAQLDVVPMIKAIVNDIEQRVPGAQIARRFHLSIADMFANACAEVRAASGLQTVALSGDIFQNRLLLEELVALLKRLSFQVYINRRVPPNDGGLSLGQAAIAAAQLR